MTAARPTKQPRPAALARVSTRDLLASCAAAVAISRPPRDPEAREPAPGPAPDRRTAA
ncbi:MULTISPECIES: hypothetical protein [Streptomyces]|uniref:hypothetical protein n=1 Tax=Streptomyces TaxID=1883 RepID=UPI000B04F204|nr:MULTISPECIES: hypothetical protein [Streptomyces]MCH0556332.1 hypothetical protein [Streptomyces sp. MUM 16J]